MKKILALLLVAVMILSLVGCGGGGRADDAFVGKWISVAGTAMGITLTGDDVSGFGLDLKAGGKGTMTIDGDSANIKWTNDDANLTITVEGEELVGAIGEDTLVFTNLLDMGMDLTFAKEGTDAAKLENVLPENEKQLIGSWTSNKVTDVIGDDVAEIPADSLKMTFAADHTVEIEFNGESITGETWIMLDEWGCLEESEHDFIWELKGDELEVTYNGGEYWIFTCTK